MNISEVLSKELVREFETFASLPGKAAEKLALFQKLVSGKDPVKNPDTQYALWLQLFKEEPLPLAWLPGSSEAMKSNVGKLQKEKGFATYRELHAWSVASREAFWEWIIKKLDIQFQHKYTCVLDLSKGAEDPVWLKDARMNIIDSCFLHEASAAAIIQGSEDSAVKTITFGDLQKLVNRIANGLINHGFLPGDAIVLYMPMTIESIAAYLAIVKAGMAVVSVADSFSATELKKRIEITKAKGVFTCDGYLYGGKTIDVFSKIKEADAPLAIISDYTGKAQLRKEKQDLLFNDLLGKDVFESYYAVPDAATNILFSSGTTKEPKAIPWTHLTPIKCASDGYFHQDIQPGDVVTWTTGMGWMMAPWLIYASLINKATIAIFTGAATSEKFGHFVDEAKVTVLGTIPSVVKTWRSQAFHEKFKWDTVKLFSSTGEPSNQEDYFYLMSIRNFVVPVIEYCGGTEIGGGYITGSVTQPASPAVFTTPALGMHFYLFDAGGQVAAPGEQGEVFIVPPSIGLTQRLLNRNHHEEYYEGTPKGPGGEVLRKHGDAFETVEWLETLFYKSIGRVDDAMNLGGIKVSAVEIEEVLNKHLQLLETAAISVPAEGGGPERLIVYFKAREAGSDKEVLKKELQALLTKQLNPLFRISEIIEKQVLPRTASNKLMRRELRKEYMQQSGK